MLGHEVFEKGKGCRCLSFCSTGSLFEQQQDIIICYRLCTGVSWIKNQPGDETGHQGPKGNHGGCGVKCMDLAAEKYECGRILIR